MSDEQYKPWQKDGGVVPPAPAAAPPRRDVRALSADELLARPAPLPSTEEAPPPVSEKLRAGLSKIGALARAANERIEPGRRAKAAASAAASASRAALDGGQRAASAIAASTADAAGKAKAKAAPRLRSAAAAVQDGLVKGASATASGLSKGAAGARDRMGQGAKSATDKLRAAIPARPEAPPPPASELDRLVEREGGADAPTAPAAPLAAAAPTGLPLFTGTQAGAPPPAPAPSVRPAMPAAVPAPPAEALQMEEDRPAAAAASATAYRDFASTLRLSDWARHPASWVLAGLALVLAGFGLGRWTSGGVGGAGFGAAVEAHILENPDIVPRALERLQANRAAEAIDQVRDRLNTPFAGAWAGAAGGDVTVTVFTDYACTFCRVSVADLDRLIREDRNVKIVFRELPILSADSEAAARVALVAARRGRYMDVHRALFRAQVPDAAARRAVLAGATLNVMPDQLTDAAINRELASNVELARALGVDATPAWVIGDRLLIGAVGYDQLRRAVAEARQ